MSVSEKTLSQDLGQSRGLRQNLLWSFKSVFLMSKPTVSLLVVVTLVPSMVMANKGLPSPLLFIAVILGTFLSSASAAIFNHVVEKDTDQLMIRTKARPVASGSTSKWFASICASVLAVVSFLILYYVANPLTAWVALIANIFYVVVYTIFLKPRTVQNIVIGGAAGAVGPLIGWASVKSNISLEAWLMFALIFMWTPPHFWALALKYKEDYAKAKIPMLPVVMGDEETRKQIAIYAWLMIPIVAMMCGVFLSSWWFKVSVMAFSVYFAWMCTKLYFAHENKLAMPVFHVSCFYLFVVFALLSFDQIWIYL